MYSFHIIAYDKKENIEKRGDRMYRAIEDFVEDWKASSAGTLNVFQAITDDKMGQAIVEGHNSLGWLAWHLTNASAMFGNLVGLSIEAPSQKDPPSTMKEIIATYEKLAASIAREAAKLEDQELLEEVEGIGGPAARGRLLRVLIDHQTHHRGQMTVLLRQAGLKVPPIMGPTKEMQ